MISSDRDGFSTAVRARVRRARTGAIFMWLVIGSITVGFALALFLNVRHGNYGFTAVSTLMLAYMLWVTRNEIQDERIFAILPYFDRPVSGAQTFGRGKSLPRHSRVLDQIAVEQGLQPLAEFGFNDDLAEEPLQWHATADGLATVYALIASIEADALKLDDADEVLADLRRIRDALFGAEQVGAQFCLLVRMGSSFSFQELGVRKGYVGDERKDWHRPGAPEGE